jgi:antitoxin (DNA-binding transcriptional repressor) of toxin-antitoxin stability system
MKTMDAAKMAEGFPTYLGRVVSRGESFEIIKEGVACAYLVPAGASQYDSHQLADDIAGVEITAADRNAMASGISKGRKVFKPVKNPWA